MEVNKLGIAGGLVVAVLLLFYLTFLNHVGVNNIGIVYDSVDGSVTIQKMPGWYVTPPTVLVAQVSTLPIRVTIPSNARVIVTKLVRFRPDGAIDFVNIQGFDYSMGQQLENILLGYAFSGGEYPFMEIMQEAGSESMEGIFNKRSPATATNP
ncbi:MAG: hypothetical protein WAP55_02725 [Minisyncoccia bacterium]